jgi:hypothetical protein
LSIDSFGIEYKQRYRIYRQHDVKLREDLIKVDVCWRAAESHLAGIASLVKHEYIKEDDIPGVINLVQTFYDKLIETDLKIERVRKPFFGLKKVRYVFGCKGLNDLIEELEKWCNRLNHNHIKTHLIYKAEG